jgi:hypothetical protein
MISLPVDFTDSGNIAFTAARVPTGINAGVWIVPWAVSINPVRALLLIAFNWNLNLFIMILYFSMAD